MTSPLLGQMMDVPLLVSSLLAHAARHFGDTEIVSRRIEGDIHRYTYRDCEKRAQAARAGADRAGRRSPASASARSRGTATGIWSCYYGTTGMGAVCHTINPRLFPGPDRLHHQSRRRRATCCFDMTFAPLVDMHRAAVPEGERLDRARRCVVHLPSISADLAHAARQLRDADRRAGRRLRLAALRRAHGLVPLLHVGHDGQSEGRALFASLDGAARVRRGAARCDGPLRARRDPARRADVPCERVGHAARRAARRREARASRARTSTASRSTS